VVEELAKWRQDLWGELIAAGGGLSHVEPSSKCMLGHKDAFT
jgi:hypothetical protein